jgi:hypothetical protein
MRFRAVAAVAALALLLGSAAAHAQAEPAPPPSPPPSSDLPPQLSAPPPNPLVTAPPLPAPRQPQALSGPQPKPRWVKPVTIALIVGAVGFAAASIAVISSGPTSDESRVDVGAGLGGGFIACALGGVIVGFVVH